MTPSKIRTKQEGAFSRRFTAEDQARFAVLSGDENPMHLSETDARRLMFGEPVVHGIHGVLWALQELAQWGGVRRLTRLKASFLSPLRLDRNIDARIIVKDGMANVKLVDTTGAAFKIKFEFDPEAAAKPWIGAGGFPDNICTVLEERSFENLSGELELAVPLDHLKLCLPGLYTEFDHFQLAVILATTRLVGMKCPGLHSLFLGLDLHFPAEALEDDPSATIEHLPKLTFDAVRVDPRFSLIDLSVIARSSDQHGVGSIRSAFRPAPVDQASYAACADAVTPDTFADQTALVIGGSRGLGEVTTKLLAAGGADVTFTYCAGAQEAEKIADSICTNGGNAKPVPFNILDCETVDGATLSIDDIQITHLYYFPSPKIKSNSSETFDTDLYVEFQRFYVDGLNSVLEMLITAQGRSMDVFYPSSEFLDTPQSEFREYEAAKSDGEMLCEQWETRFSGKVQFRCPRIPRVRTDQTAALLPSEAQDPLPIMTDLLISFAQKRI